MYSILIEAEFLEYNYEAKRHSAPVFYVATVHNLEEAAKMVENIFGGDLVSVKFQWLGEGSLIEIPKNSIEEIKQLNDI